MLQTTLPQSSSSTSMSPLVSTSGDNNNLVSIPYEVIQTNIISRLDGPTLAAAGCASSELHALVTSENLLWEKICHATWPSTSDPRIRDVISTFRSGFRSFFSDSYPLIPYDVQLQNLNYPSSTTSLGLISAVDIYYKGSPIFSKVVEMEVEKETFMCSPLRVDLVDSKEFVDSWIRQEWEDEVLLKELEENVTLSWILIDPERKRAVNLSSQRAVMAQRHWLTGEVQLKFAVVLGGGERGTEKEHVECSVLVTCASGSGTGDVHPREVCMGMEDMEGRGLSGRDSLVILLGAMEGGERKRRGGSEVVGEEGKRRYEEFRERKEDWEMRKMRMEKVLDLVSVVGGVLVVLPFWSWLFGVFY